MASKEEKTNLLLCPSTLQQSARSEQSIADSRENLKALLTSPAPEAPLPLLQKRLPELEQEPIFPWEQVLSLLVDEFLSRRSELLKLNKARKTQIENTIRHFCTTHCSLEEIVLARTYSQESEGLTLFAHEVAVFQLLQILLMKRWVDLGLIDTNSSISTTQTLNWKISSFLKKNGRHISQKHDWGFLKQNCYSWFAPKKETLDRIQLMIQPVALVKAGQHFLLEILQYLSAHSRLSVIGFSPTLIEPRHAWELLLEQIRIDQGASSYQELRIAKESTAPVLISGLANGDSLSSLKELLGSKELQGIWAFSNNDFQRFLTEINLLWISASDIPQVNLHAKNLLSEQAPQGPRGNLFGDSVRMPYLASYAACFPEENSEELIDAVQFLDQLKEHGQMLLVSDTFWPTDLSEASQKLREATLKKSCLQLIVDLRYAVGTNGEKLPKGIFLFSKSSSKEIRDDNRPFILKLKGQLSSENLPQVWRRLLGCIEQGQYPGDVLQMPLASESIKLESMAAATSQQHLRSAPWLTLTESCFYEVSGQLKRHAQKAFASGTLLRVKNAKDMNFERGIYINDIAGKALKADLHEGQFLFLPDKGVPEHPHFFIAQVNSAPMQFWYHLECEQEEQRRSRGQQKQNEQLLKMMPLVRLFPNGTLIPAIKQGFPATSFQELEKKLQILFKAPQKGIQFSAEIHQIIVNLEHSIEQNLGITREFSHHLYPELNLERWDLPQKLPVASPTQSLKILQHLDHTPLLRHPSIHTARMKPGNDFKITDVKLNESHFGPNAELEIYSGIDPILKLAGPSIFLKVAHLELQKRIGRSWQDSALKILLPTDAGLVNAQLSEIMKTIQEQLKNTRSCIDLMDRIFCYLLQLSKSFDDDSALQMIRRRLSNEEVKVALPQQPKLMEFTLENFAIPKGILQ